MTVHADLAQIPALNGRYDLYGLVHKGLRRMQCHVLPRLGANDFADADTTGKLLADMKRLLSMAAAHVEHEDSEIHVALQRYSVSTDLVDTQHDDHRATFKLLEEKIAAVEDAQPSGRAEAGRALYLAFAAYVADDFAHMHEEETVIAPILWTHFSDAELHQMEMRIIASMPPEENMAFMRVMLPAMNPSERKALVGGMLQTMPPEVFHAALEFAIRPSLTAQEFASLRADLGHAA
ncbi:MAG: hypothetical protein H6Q99_3664 [Proteobacteria bacterium]|nr:hypothetical protein [Pseudomonadota bacterium]